MLNPLGENTNPLLGTSISCVKRGLKSKNAVGGCRPHFVLYGVMAEAPPLVCNVRYFDCMLLILRFDSI